MFCATQLRSALFTCAIFHPVFSGLPDSGLPFSVAPRSGVFRGPLGDAPLWPEHKNFLNTLNQKNFFFNSGVPRPLLQWGGDTPPHTPPHWRLRRLEPRVFGSGPPSQNPKYATGPTLCTSGFTGGITYEYVFP